MTGDVYTNPVRLTGAPSGWTVSAIEDLCVTVTSGGTPLRSNKSFYQNGTNSWFKTQELKDSILFESSEKITDEALKQSSAKLFPAGTVLMAMYGDGSTITSLGLLGKEAATNQACCAMIPNRSLCEPWFLFYALKHHRRDFIQLATGGAQRNLNGGLIRRFALNVPSISEQQRIVHVLASLDKKIELNQRNNRTLQSIVHEVFKDWFVNFGPTRAKLEGRSPYLSPDLWSLFPDQFDESGKPDGWRRVPLLNHARIISGGTPKTEVADYWGGEIAWASAKDVSQCADAFLITTERSITSLGLNESSTKLIPKFATVVVARGATTGRFCIFGREMAMNQTCYALSSLEMRPFWLACAFESLVEVLVHAAHGSVFDTITTKTLEGVTTIIASEQLQNRFECMIAPFFLKMLANIEETFILAQLRDLLLPKLISGDLRVPEAEALVEAIV